MRNEPWIHEVVMKFLPPQFPRNWCKCIERNFIHLKIFNMTKYIEVLVKYATPGKGTTNGFIFQTINSKIESWGHTWPALTVRLKSMKFVRFVKCLFGHSHFGNSFSYKKEKDVASIVPWAEITSVPYSRVTRWTFETSDMGFILLQRQNSWFATTWQDGHVGGQYNRIFFPRRKKCFCSWPPTWPPWRHVQTNNPIRSLHRTNKVYTAISREVVGKNVHATIPKGNMGYDQYTTYFCCFPLAPGNTFPWPFVPILSNFFEKQRTQNHPQCLSGL